MSTTLWPGALDAFDLLGSGEFHENSSDLWNDLRAALESMEGTLGIDPAGDKADFDARMSVNLDADGAFLNLNYGAATNGDFGNAPVNVVHSAGGKFASAPHVFAQVSETTSFVSADMPAVINFENITTTAFEAYGRKLGGNAPTALVFTEFTWLCLAQETSPETIYKL